MTGDPGTPSPRRRDTAAGGDAGAGADAGGRRADGDAGAGGDAGAALDAEAILRPAAPDLAAVGEALVSEGSAPVGPSPTLTTPAPTASGPAAVGAPSAPRLEAPSPDVAVVPAASRIPGAPRDGYHQLPTAPVITSAVGPVDGESVPWTPPAPPDVPRRRPVVAPWALALAIAALAASLFVGWMLPVGLAAAITAIVALRRPAESRAIAVWALVLGVVAVLYSTGWLLWALSRLSAT